MHSRAKAGRPVMHSVLHLPLWVGERLKRADLAAHPIVEPVRQWGIRLARGEQTMRAMPCPEDVARHLDIAPGEPVFLIRRLICDESGRPVMFNGACFRWDSFAYSMTLEPSRPREARTATMAGEGLRMLQG